jgi:arylsulfatase A-like enzyme
MAGGGIKRGAVVGATDDFSYKVVDTPIHIHDLQATILHCMGIDHEKFTYRFEGRDYRLTDVHGRVVPALLA